MPGNALSNSDSVFLAIPLIGSLSEKNSVWVKSVNVGLSLVYHYVRELVGISESQFLPSGRSFTPRFGSISIAYKLLKPFTRVGTLLNFWSNASEML